MSASTCSRINLFRIPHKGYRFLLFELATEIMLANWGDKNICQKLRQKMDNFVWHISFHRMLESIHVAPKLEQLIPGFTLSWQKELIHIKEIEIRLHSLFDSVCDVLNEEHYKKLGHHIECTLSDYIVHCLLHFRREEEQWNAILSALLSDEELMEIQGNILRDVASKHDVLLTIMRGLNLDEKRALLQLLEIHLPVDLLHRTRGVICQSVSKQEEKSFFW
jgi:hypothetical protein